MTQKITIATRTGRITGSCTHPQIILRCSPINPSLLVAAARVHRCCVHAAAIVPPPVAVLCACNGIPLSDGVVAGTNLFVKCCRMSRDLAASVVCTALVVANGMMVRMVLLIVTMRVGITGAIINFFGIHASVNSSFISIMGVTIMALHVTMSQFKPMV